MKIITLKQPWASLVAEGYKDFEIRSWQTKYRGPILIHAGKGAYKDYMHEFDDLKIKFPKSRIIAKAIIEDCLFIDEDLNTKLNQIDKRIYGPNSRIGKYAWKLSHIEKIDDDNYVEGHLGLWNIEV